MYLKNRIILLNLFNQFYTTLLHVVGFIKKGQIRKALMWFYVKNRMSLFSEVNDRNCKNISYLNQLYYNSFQELNPLEKNEVDQLVSYFLDKISHKSKYSNLENYFDDNRGDGYIRSEQVSLENEHSLLKMIFDKTKVDDIASDFLGIRKENLYFSAKIDSLIRINGVRKHKNGYDDALEYHRDVDSLKFVKAFIYLNDVDIGSGHHELLLKSHRNIPFELRFLKRFKDSDLQQIITKCSHHRVVGRRGYSWIENTTCFHRGTIPTGGDRLMLTISFNDKSAAMIHDNVYFPFCR
jgi:hypothetical protein